MVSKWLLKEEPKHYSFDDLLREGGRTTWNGVRNNLALKYLRSVKKEDQAFYYHSGSETAIIGTLKILSDPYPDPDGSDPQYVVVDVEATDKLPRPISLSEMRKNDDFKNFDLLRLPRLSVLPVPQPIWNKILSMSGFLRKQSSN